MRSEANLKNTFPFWENT